MDIHCAGGIHTTKPALLKAGRVERILYQWQPRAAAAVDVFHGSHSHDLSQVITS